MTNDNRELIPADPYSTDDLDRAEEHIFRTSLPGSVKNALASKLREMRSRADDPGYFGPDRFTLPAEILELPIVAADLIAPIAAALSLLDRAVVLPEDRGRTLALISDLRQILAGA